MTYEQLGGALRRHLRGAMALAVLACFLHPVEAVTIANWDFEDGVDGQEFTPVGTANGTGGSIDTANGILMRGFDEAFGPTWTSNSSNGVGLAMNLQVNDGPNVTSDGYVTEGALHNWAPTAWTIETTVLLRDIGGWRTLIGRDGSSQAEPESDFYLTKNGIDDQFRINIDTTGGQRWILDGQPAGGVQPNTWYGVVARSDGTNLDLWVDDGFSGYQQVATLDISAQSIADNALPDTALNWTFGRGWYDGGFVDHVDGIMDNVRFSDVALDPSEFIPVEVQSPLTLVVNPDTGAVNIRNTSTEDVSFDYYRIDSPTDGALLTTDYDGSTGWNSLSDQGVDSIGSGDGESWDEAPGAISANLLVEQFLLGDTTLSPGASVSLGAPYTGLADGDLEFRFAEVDGALLRANVIYSTGELEGDFNGDGAVDSVDYAIWRESLGSTTELAADASGNGVIDTADFVIWNNNFGSSALGQSAAPTPEPATLLLLLSGIVATASGRRR